MAKTIFNQKHPNQNRSIRRPMYPARLKGNNQGMTMVEVLMGFVLLLLMLGMLSGILALSSRMFENSVDLRRAQESLQQAVYKTTVTGSPAPEETLTLVPDAVMPGAHAPVSLSAKLYVLSTRDILAEEVEKDSLDMNFYFVK